MNKITDIEVQKRNEERVNVYIDGEFTFACDLEFVYKEKLKSGMTIDIETVKKIVVEDEKRKCKNAALRMIERNYKTEKEIYNKLIEKGYEEDTVMLSIEFLKQYNYVDDQRYAKMYIKDRLRTQGKNKIRYALLAKGINEHILTDAFFDIDGDLERDVAINIAKKRYESLKKRETDKFKLSQKLYRFLVSKGYVFELVSSVVKSITNEELEEEY